MAVILGLSGTSMIHAQTRAKSGAGAKPAPATAGKNAAGKPAKATATRPAADPAREAEETRNAEELANINRRLNTDFTAALDGRKLDAAGQIIDEASTQLAAYLERTQVKAWHRSVASIHQLLERKRIALAQKLKAAGNKDVIVPTRPKIPPATLRELAETRKNLQQVTGMITRGDVEQAKKILEEADEVLTRAVADSGAPVWHEVLAPALQVLDMQRSALDEELKTRKEAAVVTAEEAAEAREVLKVGDKAPVFTATTLDGKPMGSKTYAGKWILIDFWATWCGPCKAEMPFIREAYKTYEKDPRVVIISLSIDNAIGAPREFVKDNDMRWVQGFLGKGWNAPLLKQFGVSGIPAIFLIDPQGRVAAKGLRGQRISQVLEQVLNDKPSGV